jgi:phage shock protein PspC (stress-responsive transcriptional regulator)
LTAPSPDQHAVIAAQLRLSQEKVMDWKLQQLRKSSTDRVLDGVCGGLGEYTPVPALIWRVIFVVAALTSGSGLIAYVLMWWLMPVADSTGASAGSTWNLHALRRSADDRQIAGICGGLGEYTPVPTWLWRAAFVGLVFAGGLGLLAYLLLWIFVPKAEAVASAA